MWCFFFLKIAEKRKEWFFQLFSIILIGVATYGKSSAVVDSLPIIGGIAASGAILLIISVVGLYGTLKHHQVMLFCYMLIVILLSFISIF